MRTNKHERWMNETIEALYDGILDEAAWKRGLGGIAARIGGQGPYLASFVPTTGVVLRDDLPGYDAEVMNEFRAQWATKDIRVPAGRSLPVERLVTEAMILPKGSWERSEIFNEFLYKEDMGWFLACWLHKSPSKLTCLSVQATRDRGPFGVEDIRSIRPVIPHVRRALAIKDQLQARNFAIGAISEALERAPFGVVLLDPQGRFIEMSRSAQLVLEDAGLLKREPGRTFSFSNPVGRELRELMSSRMTRGVLDDGLLHAARADGRGPLSLVVAPVQRAHVSWTSDQPSWFVFVFDPERPLRVSIETLQAELGLTHREAQVAALLARGESLAGIAQVLRISAETARAHLKAIFMKTGCHSQAELVRRVALGPASRG